MRKSTLLLLGLTHMACSGDPQADRPGDTGSAVATDVHLRLLFASPDLSEVTCNAEAACADVYIGESATPANEAEGGIPFGSASLLVERAEGMMIHITAHGADNTAENRIISFEPGVPAGWYWTAAIVGTRADDSGEGYDQWPVVHSVTEDVHFGEDGWAIVRLLNGAPGLDGLYASINNETTDGPLSHGVYNGDTMWQKAVNDAPFTVTADRRYSGHIDLIAGETYHIVLLGVLPTTGGQFLALQYETQSSTATPILLTPVD